MQHRPAPDDRLVPRIKKSHRDHLQSVRLQWINAVFRAHLRLPPPPKQNGYFGPYTSASSKPTLFPIFASATARFTDSVVLPTPPLPEPTAIMASTPGNGCGPGAGCPG